MMNLQVQLWQSERHESDLGTPLIVILIWRKGNTGLGCWFASKEPMKLGTAVVVSVCYGAEEARWWFGCTGNRE